MGSESGGAASTERRNYARAAISKLAVVEQPDAPATPAVVMDVSETGAQLKMPHPPSNSAQYLLHFKIGRGSYSTRFRVVRSATSEGGQYMWGCEFKDLRPELMANLRSAVYELFGRPHVRPWPQIKHDCSVNPSGKVLIGCTAAGKEVFVASRDALHLGDKGVHQFVLDVEDAAHGAAAPLEDVGGALVEAGS